MEYEAIDKHRHALLKGLGFSEQSKTVNGATVKPEEFGQEDDKEMLEGTEKTRFWTGWAYKSREGVMHEDGETRGVEKVTWAMRAWKHDEEMNVDVHVDSDWAKKQEEFSEFVSATACGVFVPFFLFSIYVTAHCR